MVETFLNNVDTSLVSSLLEQTDNNVRYFEEVVDGIVNTYTSHLDGIMANIKNAIVDSSGEAPTGLLENYLIELSNNIYFVSEKLEKLGIYRSISETAYKEVYNKAYLSEASDKDVERKSKKTINELTSLAANASIYESTVSDIYDRAYSIVKAKLSSAQTMVSSLSKVLSSRMSDAQLTMITSRNGVF